MGDYERRGGVSLRDMAEALEELSIATRELLKLWEEDAVVDAGRVGIAVKQAERVLRDHRASRWG